MKIAALMLTHATAETVKRMVEKGTVERLLQLSQQLVHLEAQSSAFTRVYSLSLVCDVIALLMRYSPDVVFVDFAEKFSSAPMASPGGGEGDDAAAIAARNPLLQLKQVGSFFP